MESLWPCQSVVIASLIPYQCNRSQDLTNVKHEDDAIAPQERLHHILQAQLFLL